MQAFAVRMIDPASKYPNGKGNYSNEINHCSGRKILAERVGFEPTIPVKVYTLSKRAPSATRPSLRGVRGTLNLS